MSKGSLADRAALRLTIERLLEHLESSEGLSTFENEVEAVLRVILDGFDQLDQGQLPLAFRPRPTKQQGERPADVRQLRIWAFRDYEALRRRKVKAKDAEAVLAAAYDVGVDALKVWRQNLQLEAPPEVRKKVEKEFPNKNDRRRHRLIRAATELGRKINEDVGLERGCSILGIPMMSVSQIKARVSKHGAQYQGLSTKKPSSGTGKK